MTNQLQFYDAAKAALAKAVKVDEVQKIHNKAVAIKAAAKIAKDTTLEADAHEIRLRAERRLYELMEKQKETVGFNKGAREPGTNRGTTRDSQKPASLSEAGIDKNLAKRARQAGKPSDKEFEHKVAAEKEQIKSPAAKPVALKTVKPPATPMNEQRDRLRALWKSGRDKYASFFAVLEEVRASAEVGNDGLSAWCMDNLRIGLSVITETRKVLTKTDANIVKRNLAEANNKKPYPPTSTVALANFLYAVDHWVPNLNADDLKNARAYFQDNADAWEKALAASARANGSAEQSVEERKAANAKLAEEEERAAKSADAITESVNETIAKQTESAPAQ